ncbi:hypothetical protein N7456_011388 [Penicillium angulare]|uniref:Protein kinase domain-containing protein n=1 Tax=Penicillium angulare TaxID=116970 RepID=A0A9W9ETK0_9EURO|nr:hypothetical protein N7456_011388 [Penicillium angulare]
MENIEAAIEDSTDFGDLIEDSFDALDIEYPSESWLRYGTENNQHVLYPIYLGEVLNERYLVEHKLGFGGGSVVWMAFDLKDKRSVALKIMALGLEWTDNECNRVLVFPMKGPSIYSLRVWEIPVASRISAARQLLETLASLHEAGIIHRGKSRPYLLFQFLTYTKKNKNIIDLNTGNCMWGVASLDGLTRAARYELLGRPQKVVTTSVELWKRCELVSTVEFPQDLRTDELYLCDFGLSKNLATSPPNEAIHLYHIALQNDFMGKNQLLLVISGAT